MQHKPVMQTRNERFYTAWTRNGHWGGENNRQNGYAEIPPGLVLKLSSYGAAPPETSQTVELFAGGLLRWTAADNHRSGRLSVVRN